MIVHLALYKWKRMAKNEEINKIVKEIKSLKNKVKGIIDIKAGKNFSKWSLGYSHAFVVFAKDKVSLERYRDNKMHKKIAAKIEKIEEESLGFDFED
jgi:hypothetical protein